MLSTEEVAEIDEQKKEATIRPARCRKRKLVELNALERATLVHNYFIGL